MTISQPKDPQDMSLLHSRRRPPAKMKPEESSLVVADVCCGCRPSSSSKRRVRRFSLLARWRTSSQRGKHGEGGVPRTNHIDSEDEDDKDSLFFFDACETPLAEDEYPPTFTNYLPPKRKVSLEEPWTMLSRNHNHRATTTITVQEEEEAEDSTDRTVTETSDGFSDPSSSSQRSTVQLQQPRVKLSMKGFPGNLTMSELQECQKLLAALETMDPGIREQVFSFQDVEEEPYTICRWLRTTKFNAETLLRKLQDNQAHFATAQAQNFYPKVSQVIGIVPYSVFLSQWPFLPIGKAKNGCPVNYFQAGKIHPEGVLACTTPQEMEGYFWWSFMYKFKDHLRQAQARDENFVRMEGINVIDLQGLSSDSLSGEAMEVMKLSAKISDFFPGTLHCMLILNAPSFFSIFWGLTKKLLDPRTAAQVQVFSNKEKGLAALRQLVAETEIPADYGGTNKSTQQAFIEESADPTLLRQEIELLHVHGKKNKVAEFKEPITLGAGEYLEVRVFTRSATSADVTVLVNDQVYNRVNLKGGRELLRGHSSMVWSAGALEEEVIYPSPTCTKVVTKLNGPARKVMIQIQDRSNDSSDVQHKKSKGNESRGYFLVACDVKKQQK